MAKGGMSDIVEGFDRDGRRVAIKLLREGFAKDAEIAGRFRREARTVAELTSPHTVRILDFGAPEGSRPYIVMEFLTGHDLAHELGLKGNLPLEDAATWMAQACHSIVEAHAAGIVHRDLKPRNLYLAEEGDRRILKVLDFGIAKHDKVSGDDPVTHTKATFGSPFYMSPETFRAAKLADARSDVWSLGVIFYELLTGAVPFLRETALAVGLAVSKEEHVPPTQRVPSLPRSADVVVARALKKDPNERYQSVRELLAAIEVYLPRGRNETMMIPAVSAPSDRGDDDQRTIRRDDVVTELGMMALPRVPSSPAVVVDDIDAPTRIKSDDGPPTSIAGAAISVPTPGGEVPLFDTSTGRVAGPVAISTLPEPPIDLPKPKKLSPVMIAVPAVALVFGLGGWLLGRSPDGAPANVAAAAGADQQAATPSPTERAAAPPAAQPATTAATTARATVAVTSEATAVASAAVAPVATAEKATTPPPKQGTAPKSGKKAPAKGSGKYSPSKI
jgi:serine/threonine-protein kinase